ncbi:MAG TPA: ABC-2 family transporter protein [Opitutaceae bacterium]|nr:ABC-2 family transporter protein [Opitutaceae bacterium]
MSLLRKYGHVFSVGLQSALVYRWNFFIRGSFSLVHLCLVFILWGAAYSGVAQMGGFDVRATLTYFIVVLALQFMVGAFNEDYQIGEEIRNGLINQFLLKPVNYFGYRLSLFASARIISGLLVFVPLLAVSPWIIDQLTFPSDPWRLPVGIAAMLLAAALQFTIAFCFGMLAFWFLEIQGFVILSYAIEMSLGGAMFPLDLLSPRVLAVAQYLPFPYQMYFPAAIITGRIRTLDEALLGLAIQGTWVVVAMFAARFLWAGGLRKHTAVGG